MTTLLAHLQIKPGHEAGFEAIAREMVRDTIAGEPGCLRYEYWRGAEPGRYYVLLAFTGSTAFYEHQASDWHEGNTPALRECWETISLEVLDPVPGANPLPPTAPQPLPASASPAMRAHREAVPIARQAWWDQVAD